MPTAVQGPTCMAFDQLARTAAPRSLRAGDHLDLPRGRGVSHSCGRARFLNGHAAVLWHDEGGLHSARERQSFENFWGAVGERRIETGFQPVVSGILPETWGAHYAQSLPNVRAISIRAKSGRLPDLTGWKPVPPTSGESFQSGRASCSTSGARPCGQWCAVSPNARGSFRCRTIHRADAHV